MKIYLLHMKIYLLHMKIYLLHMKIYLPLPDTCRFAQCQVSARPIFNLVSRRSVSRRYGRHVTA